MKQLLPVLVALCCLQLGGCLELVRRPGAAPSAGESGADALPATSLPTSGNLSSPVDVQDSAVTSTQLIKHRERSRTQKEDIRQVNEYALWCLEHAMWNEARSHMEHALARDSLSASLHNNLGIVYEHFGLHEKAADFYRRAQVLNQQNAVYQSNLQHLERLQQAGQDSSAKIDIFDLRERTPGRRREPFQNRRHRAIFTGE